MFDFGTLLGSWTKGKGEERFKMADPTRKVSSPYDIPTDLIDDMIARNVRPFVVQRLDLTTANTTGLEIAVSGFHVVLYGTDGSLNRAVNTTAFVEVFWEKLSGGDTGFPMKHARGLSGPFSKLVLKWPAQSNVYADLVILTGMFTPWIDGESCT